MQFARDPAGQRGLTTFEPKDHTIYCIVGISNPSAEAKYKFVWSYYDRALNQRTELFTQDVDNQTANEVISKFSSPHDLAAGTYTVDIYIDGRKRQSRNFYV
jgi:outer membrane usher protein FimD/PapC